MNYLKYRYVFLVLSLVIIISGIAYGFSIGYRFDIDFKGGTKTQIDLKVDFENYDIETIVSDIIGSRPLVQKMSGGDSSVSITTDVITEEKSNEIISALKERYPDMDEPSTRNIQPSFGRNLIESSILAIIVSILFILIFVGVRFKTLGFTAAVTAILALVHDVLIIIAIYGFLKLSINSTFVAVLLTIIGYSINDTIIVYDRIRENRRKVTRAVDLKDTINKSISQTMKRTISTSFTTLSAIVVVLVFAYMNNQQVLTEFALPLTIGVIVGTYSSIFVATSLWYIFEEFKNKSKKAN